MGINTFEAIWIHAHGIPRLMIKLFLKAVKELFLKQKEFLDEECVISAAQNMHLIGVDDKLNIVTEIQKIVLKHILLSNDDRGIRPIELTTILHRSKATVAYHLDGLIVNKILIRIRFGKYSFYQIKEELIPTIQLKLMREEEFHG